MQFSWIKSFWKGVQGTIELAATAALYAGADVIIRAFETTDQIVAAGAPAWLVPIIFFGVRMAANYLKVRRASPEVTPEVK